MPPNEGLLELSIEGSTRFSFTPVNPYSILQGSGQEVIVSTTSKVIVSTADGVEPIQIHQLTLDVRNIKAVILTVIYVDSSSQPSIQIVVQYISLITLEVL